MLNPKLLPEKVGSKHERLWQELSADLLEEALEKGSHFDEEPHIFYVADQCKLVLTDMCKFAIIQHLRVPDTRLASFPRTLDYLKLDGQKREEWESLVGKVLQGVAANSEQTCM